MSEWISFEGQVIPMPWGESVYTVLPIPDDVLDAHTAQGAKRVEVELNDVPFNMALTKAPVLNQTFVYTGKSVLAEAAIEPGDIIDVRLRKADPNYVEVPEDILQAIRAHGCLEQWQALTPGKMRGLLHTITTAKRAETRQARIAKLISALHEG